MTDISSYAQPQDSVSRRLARRHRAEQRFRFYGIAAIGLSISFLVFLLVSIFFQAMPAFTVHELSLDVEIVEDLADPLDNRSEESLRAGSYNRMIQLSLQDQFPSVTERAQLRELFRLYSPVNSARLLRSVVDDPSQVGQTVDVSFPISDDADLYLKGLSVDETRQPGRDGLTISSAETGVTLTSPSPVFQPFLDEVRNSLLDQLSSIEARIDLARDEINTAENADERAAANARLDRAMREAEQLRARLNGAEDLTLGPALPSLFIADPSGGVLWVTALSADGLSAEAETVIPVRDTSDLDEWTLWTIETPEIARRITDRQIIWTDALSQRGFVSEDLNWGLFTRADSGEPELAGIRGALVGSVLTMLVTMVLAVPIGIGAAIYLEEFAPKNWFTDLVEVNINNLAAVPSIVFGLLGLAVFINFFGMPRSAPVVGGFVLALMTLPTVIISSRAALKAVSPSIREAAYGVGASRTQAVFDHVLPLATPGMLTGSIIGLAQALGETAPLLMIGMVAFIAEPPTLGVAGLTEPATVMPVQIFLWSSGAERAFEAKTAAAILVLLFVMVSLNATAIYLRRRFERRW